MSISLVSTVTVGTNSPTVIQFSNIPQTGKDLLVLVSGRASNFNANITFNGSTSSYAYRDLRGSGSSASSGNGSAMSNLFVQFMYEPRDFNGTNNTVNHFSNSQMIISNYTSSVAKSISADTTMEFNSTESYLAAVAGSWSGTSAITSIELAVSGAGTFNENSTASLYIIS
jgi:hypothetical protein